MPALKSKNETTAMIFLDFRKAFDCADKKKLKDNGCDMIALKVIISIVDHRTQSVILNSKESTLKPVLTGVPQCSILAPNSFSACHKLSVEIANHFKKFCLRR